MQLSDISNVSRNGMKKKQNVKEKKQRKDNVNGFQLFYEIGKDGIPIEKEVIYSDVMGHPLTYVEWIEFQNSRFDYKRKKIDTDTKIDSTTTTTDGTSDDNDKDISINEKKQKKDRKEKTKCVA